MGVRVEERRKERTDVGKEGKQERSQEVHK